MGWYYAILVLLLVNFVCGIINIYLALKPRVVEKTIIESKPVEYVGSGMMTPNGMIKMNEAQRKPVVNDDESMYLRELES